MVRHSISGYITFKFSLRNNPTLLFILSQDEIDPDVWISGSKFSSGFGGTFGNFSFVYFNRVGVQWALSRLWHTSWLVGLRRSHIVKMTVICNFLSTLEKKIKVNKYSYMKRNNNYSVKLPSSTFSFHKHRSTKKI